MLMIVIAGTENSKNNSAAPSEMKKMIVTIWQGIIAIQCM